MFYALLADLIVAMHFVYLGVAIGGQLLILVGILARWQWIRNFWFRLTHLVAISIVAFEAIMNIPCPLTVWEEQLRRRVLDPLGMSNAFTSVQEAQATGRLARPYEVRDGVVTPPLCAD